MALIKIETYVIIANPVNETYKMRLNLEAEKTYELNFKNIVEMNTLVEILRNEKNCYLSEKTHDVIVGKEPVGQHDSW